MLNMFHTTIRINSYNAFDMTFDFFASSAYYKKANQIKPGKQGQLQSGRSIGFPKIYQINQ